MVRIFLFVVFCFSGALFSQKVSGIVIDEDQNVIPAVLVFNMKTEQKVYTNLNGEFTIDAAQNDELRFIRQGFERNSKIVNAQDFYTPFSIIISRSFQEIEEVKVAAVRLTGDLNQDAKNLTKFDKVAQLQKEVGIPCPPEKPREKPADAKKDILMPLLSLSPSLNIQAIYDVISGKARKQKSWYKYEDLQDRIKWIRERVDDEYFTKMGIPAEKIPEFLQYSIGIKPEINRCIKEKNLSKALFILEETFPQYLSR